MGFYLDNGQLRSYKARKISWKQAISMTSWSINIANKYIGRTFCAVLLCLYVIIQSFTLAHATAHNDEPHEHNGVECQITLLAVEADVILPPPPVIMTPEPYYVPVSCQAAIESIDITPPCRAPPGRGPPLK